MAYSRKKFREKLRTAIGSVDSFYAEPLLNYRGKCSDTGERYEDVAAAFVLENLSALENIKTVERRLSYKTEGHERLVPDNGKLAEIDSGKVRRKEEWLAKSMYGKSYENLGKIIDFQVPIKSEAKGNKTGVGRKIGTDKKKPGKIDLIAYSEKDSVLYLLEFKRPDSKENLLRCILEAYTYYRQVNYSKLLQDFELPSDSKILPAVLIYKQSEAASRVNSLLLQKLRKALGISIFLIDETKLIIHRGTDEIGGNCVEFDNGRKRIVFDVGLPLNAIDEGLDISCYKPNISGLFSDENDVAAVFISHAHPDHYGLLSLVNKNIPIYMSRASAILLKKVVPLLGKENYADLNIKEVSDGEEVKIGDFIVKAYEVDHSAMAAMAFEISVGNKKFLYSGDIRFHGRRAWRSRNVADNIMSPDYLLLEGSTLGRENQEQLTEYDIEKRLTEFFAEPKLSLIVFSTQNIDRFVSVYKACVRQNKILVLDPYSCAILENLREISTHLPQVGWNNIRVYFAGNSITRKLAENGDLYRYKTAKVTFDEIAANPEKYVVKANFAIAEKLFEKFGADNMRLIYSLWTGYLDKPGYWHDLRDKLICIHASGHACVKDLQDFVREVRPKYIIPIHTTCKNKYADLFEMSPEKWK